MADKKEEGTRQYLICCEDGTKRKITIPSTWKVTFGPATIGHNAGKRSNLKMPMALRFYEDEKHQRAIFTDVVSFRDLSIPIEEERIKRQDKNGFMEVDGMRKNVVMQAEVRSWVDPDNDDQDDAVNLLENLEAEFNE